MAKREAFILAYDIRDPKRLGRMHRLMTKWGTAIQYSVFAVDLSPRGETLLFNAISRIADADEDDVRLYRAPLHGMRWYGLPATPEGIVLTGSPSSDILSKSAQPPDSSEPYDEDT